MLIAFKHQHLHLVKAVCEAVEELQAYDSKKAIVDKVMEKNPSMKRKEVERCVEVLVTVGYIEKRAPQK